MVSRVPVIRKTTALIPNQTKFFLKQVTVYVLDNMDYLATTLVGGGPFGRHHDLINAMVDVWLNACFA